MNAEMIAGLIHPAIVVIIVYPLIGMVINFAWQTRQRRLQSQAGQKSKIPPVVGRDHVAMGRWLAGGVVGASLIALAYAIITKNLIANQLLQNDPFQVVFIVLMFVFTIATFALLYRAKPAAWRATFATLSGMGIILIGCQNGIFRRTNEWYWSHYYYGILAALLMIISVAMWPEIYQDKTLKWRRAHIILNAIATLVFIGQGITGARDLFEIGFYSNTGG